MARPSRFRAWWVWVSLWWALAAFMLLPLALGWQHTAESRGVILDQVHASAGSRIEAKFMFGRDLKSEGFLLGGWPAPDTGFWLVASSSDLPYSLTFQSVSMIAVSDDIYAYAMPIGFRGHGQPQWPAAFDRLQDRAAPGWWPLVPPRVAAVPIAIVGLWLGTVVLIRARRRGRPT